MTAVQDILQSFGITRCYKGFKHTEYAICLAIQDESRLEAITKEIYMETAEHFLNAIGRPSKETSEPPFPAHGLSIPICSARWQVIRLEN